MVAVFQNGLAADVLGIHNPGPIISFLPILPVGIFFGLAMDDEVFLVTRMREEHVHGATANELIVLGFRHGAPMVTAAALIMVAVFAGFSTTNEPVVKSIGFALAVGVFADAFLVRMTLVPALMSSRYLAGSFGELEARVVSVSPGSFDTALGRPEENHGAGNLVKAAAIKRFCQPKEMAAVISFCASRAPGYLTGVDILNDGGTKAGQDFAKAQNKAL